MLCFDILMMEDMPIFKALRAAIRALLCLSKDELIAQYFKLY